MERKKVLSLKEKMEVISAYDQTNSSVRALAKRFNIGKTQAALIVRDRETIRSRWLSGENINTKRSFLNTDGKKLDSMCYDWFCKLSSAHNTPISGSAIQEKAKELATSLGIDDFAASNGWLQRWRKRHNINSRCEPGAQSADVNPLDVHQFLETEIDSSDTVFVIDDNSNTDTDLVAELSCELKTVKSALIYIANLKQFLNNDHIAFEHLKNLENHMQNRLLKCKHL
ncbi:tigger transposable element-derived protein 3 [Drosophila virilis]|uniref:HTH CENPB-type domain-containing protein n=1 Tax=Drosophila virilis TaxID=7244 RepID=B4MDR6_DROVI|nr:tigger transposable element-derived protein 3 [Drosophila virilis]EDW71327.1 uncharacterized protein Dvir_GJ16124 [Drosophila virilis]